MSPAESVSGQQGAPSPPGLGTIQRTNVLGVGVSAVNMDMALATIANWIDTREKHYVCVTGVHGVMESRSDHELRRIHNDAGMVVPDGMPMVWLSHWYGQSHVDRVYGPDLMLDCCAQSERRGDRHFFYGGGDGVAELLIERLRSRFPAIQVAGSYTPPFRPLTDSEDEAVVRRIDDAASDIVWVGLSTPKQERWMASHVGRLRAPVLIGVGAAFDFHAGLKPQAPRWMQRAGLEWSFRLGCEPRRLWKRYLLNNPAFVWHTGRQLLRIGQHEPSSGRERAH